MNATPIFAFGTLLDRDVLSAICGQLMDNAERRSATLPGFEPRYAKNYTTPVLVLAPSSSTNGEVIFFEPNCVSLIIDTWQGEYELCKVSVKLHEGGDFQCRYFSHVGFTDFTSELWEFKDWQLKHKSGYLQTLNAMKH